MKTQILVPRDIEFEGDLCGGPRTHCPASNVNNPKYCDAWRTRFTTKFKYYAEALGNKRRIARCLECLAATNTEIGQGEDNNG